MGLATAIPAKRNSAVISIARKLRNVGTALENITKFRDFQAEYTLGHSSDNYHQRMSVSVVAPRRNHFRYNSLTVPV
jgi:hypothetical protein